jgi:hypothetical protein
VEGAFGWSGGWRAHCPLSPAVGSLRVAWRIGLVRASTGVRCNRKNDQEALGDLLEVAQVGPTGREFDHHATRRFANPGGHLDQPGAPCARLTFAERITFAAAVVPTATLSAGERFHGNFCVGRFVRRIGHGAPHVNQQVVRRCVQIEPEQVGEATMIAEAVGQQTGLEFFVATFALAAIGVAIVGGPGSTVAPARLVTTARRFVPWAFASHLITTQRCAGQESARYQNAVNRRCG